MKLSDQDRRRSKEELNDSKDRTEKGQEWTLVSLTLRWYLRPKRRDQFAKREGIDKNILRGLIMGAPGQKSVRKNEAPIDKTIKDH